MEVSTGILFLTHLYEVIQGVSFTQLKPDMFWVGKPKKVQTVFIQI